MTLRLVDWQIVTIISKDRRACSTSSWSEASRKLWIYRSI